jgi:hypothetical protein
VLVPFGSIRLLEEFIDLWHSDGLRSELVVIDSSIEVRDHLELWMQRKGAPSTVTLCNASVEDAIRRITSEVQQRADFSSVRVRIKKPLRDEAIEVDIGELDTPAAPVLERFIAVRVGDLAPLLPEELKDEDLNSFFERSAPERSRELWRPFAAGLPWERYPGGTSKILDTLSRVEHDGPEGNSLVVLNTESGAGGTTEARRLAFHAASQGYPTLVATSEPFPIDAEEVAQFFYSVQRSVQSLEPETPPTDAPSNTEITAADTETVQPTANVVRVQRLTPWLLVFDSQHWRGREEQVAHFLRKLQRLSRPVVVLVVNEVPGSPDYGGIKAQQIYEAPLTHDLRREEVEFLGAHLNRFLAVRGKAKKAEEWLEFWRENRVTVPFGSFSRATEMASFWIALEFWLRGQLRLGVSVRQWLYSQFNEAGHRGTPLSPAMRRQILTIAAMSVEREVVPEELLSTATDEDPFAAQLEGLQQTCPALGLSRFPSSLGWVWCISHVPIARYLLEAAAEDLTLLESSRLSIGEGATGIRLDLLRDVALQPRIVNRRFLPLAIRFAVTILKLDRSNNLEFANTWRKVLTILEEMPDHVWNSSRTFNHHVAISRRRVASDDDMFPDKTPDETRRLLELAVEHIQYALTLETDENERDLNLYNSLARAYQDLAEWYRRSNGSEETVAQLMAQASGYTRKAKDESPTNSYVLETLARELIRLGRANATDAVANSCEAIEYIYQALNLDTGWERQHKLYSALNEAYELLKSASANDIARLKLSGNPVGYLASAWMILSAQNTRKIADLAQIPVGDLGAAWEELEKIDADRREWPVLKLRYEVWSAMNPLDFERQLSLLEQLSGTDAMNVQMRLERAVLLHLTHRHVYAEKEFRTLRRELRESGAIVAVPKRLRRYLNESTGQAIECDGTVVPSSGYKQLARIRQLGDVTVPFEPLEFGESVMPIGRKIRCVIDFSFRGPFAHPQSMKRA